MDGRAHVEGAAAFRGKVGRGRADGKDAAELDRAEKEKERRQKEAAVEGPDMLGDGRTERTCYRNGHRG